MVAQEEGKESKSHKRWHNEHNRDNV